MKKSDAGASQRRWTGPTTERGKRHASQNARRHGLSVSPLRDPDYVARIDTLARAIVEDDSRSDLFPRARNVAEALLDIERIRQVEETHFRQLKLDNESSKAIEDLDLKPLHSDRYLKRAYGRLRSSVRRLDEARIGDGDSIFSKLTNVGFSSDGIETSLIIAKDL